MVTLREIAAVPSEEVELFGGLDAFCRDFETEVVRHRDDRRDDGRVVAIVDDVVDERLVDFHPVDR